MSLASAAPDTSGVPDLPSSCAGLDSSELLAVYEGASSLLSVLNAISNQPRCTGPVDRLFDLIHIAVDALARAAADQASRLVPGTNDEARDLNRLMILSHLDGDEWRDVERHASHAAKWFDTPREVRR